MKRLRKSLVALGVTLGIIGQVIPLQASVVPVEYPTVSINALKGSNTALTNFSVEFDGTMAEPQEQIFSTPVTIEAGAEAKIGLFGKALESWEYQIIKSDSKPIVADIDETKWKTLGDITNSITNNPSSNEDLLINQQGSISTSHYNYKYDSTDFKDGEVPPRATTFGYPIGKNMVIQHAGVNPGNEYYNTEGKGAFFPRSSTGITTLKTDYIAPKTGIYKFGVRSNSGAEGYIEVKEEVVKEVRKIVNGKWVTEKVTEMATVKKIIVDGRTTAPITSTPQYHTKGTEVSLQAGVSYTIHMVWEHKASSHNAPRLEYQIKEGTTWPAPQVIPTESFANEEYVGGANKAVKFWGFIIPEGNIKGKFNIGSHSDDGAYGYIMSGDEKIVFVENWELKQSYDRSGVNGKMPEIDLEAGKAYKIYMEWYEGCPVDKAFQPIFKGVKETRWGNIPSTWFYPSSDTTPGDVGEAYFNPVTDSTKIDFGTNPGKYYVAVKVKSLDGTVRKLLNGPFIIKDPTATGTNITPSGQNRIVPESMSNIFYEVHFDEDRVKIKHEVNLSQIIDATLNGNPFMSFAGDKGIVTIKANGITKTLTAAELQYNAATKKLNINLTDPTYNLDKNEKHIINIYLPTTFVAGVKYADDPAFETYTGNFLDTKTNVIVKVTASPFQKQELDATGNIIVEEYESPPVTNPGKVIELTYMQMIKIL